MRKFATEKQLRCRDLQSPRTRSDWLAAPKPKRSFCKYCLLPIQAAPFLPSRELTMYYTVKRVDMQSSMCDS